MLRRPQFAPLLDDVGTLPDFCVRDDLPRAANFWFGPAGTNTPLHHDTLMLLHTQVVGRKRWRFISPLQTPRLYNTVGVFSPIDLGFAPDGALFFTERERDFSVRKPDGSVARRFTPHARRRRPAR